MKHFLLLLLPLNLWAYTLNTNTAARFSSNEIKIFIASNSTCTEAGINPSDLLDLAIDGADTFWNRVPTSNLHLMRGGTFSTSDDLFNTGELCASDSDSTCDTATTVPKVSDIVIACNNNTTNFPTSAVLALTGPINISGSQIKGSVILINNTSGSAFATLSYSERRSVLAHEIGHAFGLGHTNLDHALMYFQNVDAIQRLSQDDRDGISYLYPNKLDGCGSFFGTIKDDDQHHLDIKSILYGLLLACFFFVFRVLLRPLRVVTNLNR